MRLRIAIVGAGIAGAACARTLLDAGAHVYVFEKGRGAGGRMASRREQEFAFDHGAQFFTVRHPAFRAALGEHLAADDCRPWAARWGRRQDQTWSIDAASESCWVGLPAMNRVAAALSRGAVTLYGKTVSAIACHGGGVDLATGCGDGPARFDAVVVTAPAPQARQLLPDACELQRPLAAIAYAPCWALMVAVAQPLAVPVDGGRIGKGPLSWIARNSSKPGRGAGPECWVAHASADWSRQHLEQPAAAVCAALMEAFSHAVDGPVDALFARAHRWRYARVVRPLRQPCLADRSGRMVVCGDGCTGARVEDAFLSGQAAASAILDGLG